MDDFSGRLIAWLDRELPEAEAADVEQHLQACAECRGRLAAYQQASSNFEAYCDLAIAPEMRRRLPRWILVASAAAAVAVAVLLFATLPRGRVEQPPTHSPPTHSSTKNSPQTAGPGVASEVAPPMNSIKTAHRRYAVAPVQTETGNAAPTLIQNATLLPAEPAIEISIPADAMYPPGAVPEGVNFIADLTVAADGSAEPVRLRPRRIGFERRASQP
jgi:Putative zinc-finger